MRFGSMRGGILIATALALSGLSSAVSTFAASSSISSPPEFGKTLPPIGFVKFCIENPSECVATGETAKALEMDQAQWNLVFQVNTFVNGKIAPVSDMDLYGQAEYWTYPTTAGDCEDYLLLKKRYLEGLGFPPSALLITVVLDEKQEGHAVLTLATAEGDFILDNRRNDVFDWQKSNYTFLKRQSPDNPRQWIALSRQKSASPDKLASK
jgi:predicted transglutaminase-like cysteine proteinase